MYEEVETLVRPLGRCDSFTPRPPYNWHKSALWALERKLGWPYCLSGWMGKEAICIPLLGTVVQLVV